MIAVPVIFCRSKEVIGVDCVVAPIEMNTTGIIQYPLKIDCVIRYQVVIGVQ